jgi:hypothetical protein
MHPLVENPLTTKVSDKQIRKVNINHRHVKKKNGKWSHHSTHHFLLADHSWS